MLTETMNQSNATERARVGRPRKGSDLRASKIVICVEPELKTELKNLAMDSGRSLSDYIHYLLDYHLQVINAEQET